jgi:preprotein translocase subunit SecE
MKRLLQRQGQLGADGAPTAPAPPARPAPRPAKERTSPMEYGRQVRAELRKVAWPTRAEVVNYSVIVLVALLILMGLIFALDTVFGKAVVFLFK